MLLTVAGLAGWATAGEAVLAGVVAGGFLIGVVSDWRAGAAVTLLSVVLPVFKVQGYLAQCLDSLLDQSFTDVEIIAVDDRSPDRSGEILAEYAERDPRVRVITMAENVGLGRARNAGLDAATGEYVWFVDSDDWLATGALGAVARRLRDTRADVLVVGFDRVHWDGRVVDRLGHRHPAGRARDVHRRVVAAHPQGAARRLEQDRPAGPAGQARLRVRDGLVRGRVVHVPGARRGGPDQRAAPGLRALSAAPDGRDHPYRR